MSYKVVVINNKCKISFRENHLLIDEEKKEFLDNISCIVINSLEVTMTSYLINELNRRNIGLIFCDEKKNPKTMLVDLYSTGDIYKKMCVQINIKDYNKDYTWGKIVINKLLMQQELIKKTFNIERALMEYINTVEIGDVNNCEAFAARKYFNMLFGNTFNRRNGSSINSALNYGYAILLSLVNRVIVSLGYNTAIGIKHCNQHNNFNFSCDIMEPLRPLVDLIVINNKNKEFDNDYKKELIKVLNKTILYKEKSFKLEAAIQLYFLDVIKCLKTGIDEIGMLRFDN